MVCWGFTMINSASRSRALGAGLSPATQRSIRLRNEFSSLSPVLGGEGGLRGKECPLHAISTFAKETRPHHPRPLSPDYRGEGRNRRATRGFSPNSVK